MFQHLQDLARLTYWLGIATDVRTGPVVAGPFGVDVDGGHRLLLWPSPRPTDTVVVLIAGLHMDGPADSRMDRLARVLAAGGMHVVAPRLEAFEALWIRDDRHPRRARATALAASDWACKHLRPKRQVVFSISFGSAVALHLMAERPVAHGVLFGGVADLGAALAFALDGYANPGRDPLNGPAILRNLAPLWFSPEDAAAFETACAAFCHATWSRSSRPALKDGRRFAHALQEVARGLRPDVRDLLHQATGLQPGALARVQAVLPAIHAADGPFAWSHAAPVAPRVSNPVDCVHGRDDDVVPWTSAAALAAMLPRGRSMLTGRWAHTGAGPTRTSLIDSLSENAAFVALLARLRGS
jgi:pimeloyl-ACP methyl ester carboxylesterase